MIETNPLPLVPDEPLDLVGLPRFGTYAGLPATTALAALAGPPLVGGLTRVRSEKRWQWFGAISDEVAVGGAIVQTGYAGQVFLWVFDRARGVMVVDASMTTLRARVAVQDAPGVGEVARAAVGLDELRVRRRGELVEISGRVREVELFITMDGAQVTPITAICPVPAERANITCKQAGLRASGVVRVGSKSFDLGERAAGFMDYTHGLLAYETRWRWAIGAGIGEDGVALAFNLTDGFNAGLENVIWRDGVPSHVGAVAFRYNPASPNTPWHVQTPDGRVDLTLHVEGVRQEVVDMALVHSSYVQPLGRWEGTLDGARLASCVGVAEDHVARW